MDPLLSTVEYALGGLQLRLDTAAHNIANVNTPDYRSRRVTFEADLAAALARGEATPDSGPRIVSGPPSDDGVSGVSLEAELGDLAKNAVGRQALISGFNYKIDVIRASLGVR